ncbi:glycosyltransferase [Microlunatus spumicola]|uniref:Glycosyltransferase n=1 Tax=Microlunatus spumicola TaxID=81499 RepID=A0ABP6XWP3_9ACTN
MALALAPRRHDLPTPLAQVVPFVRRHQLAVVVLTQANRPAELVRAIASVRAQRGVDVQLVLVLNGAAPRSLGGHVDVPWMGPDDQLVVLPENVGIPGGRNIGAATASADLLLFLDDDAELLGPTVLATAVARFGADAGLGAMAIRLVDEEGLTQRRHVPRVGARSALRSGPVTHFIGAACAVRADAFADLGGFDRQFFYAMEESDLSWRLLDAGWSIWYSADLTAFHPRTAPSRHPGHVVLTARNRMWASLRSLPVPVCVAYLLTWTLVAVLRGGSARQVVDGYRQAWQARPTRRPMRWSTVARMTRLGRPPVL